MQVLPLLLVLAVLVGVPLIRHRDPAGRAIALRRAGFGWIAAFAVLGGLFIAGETFADPGGWSAVLMLLAWLVPLGALSWLAWRHPDVAQRVLAVAVVGVVVYAGWAVAGWEGFRDFRNGRGPYDAIAVFVVSVALGVLGLRRARAAGLMLLVATVVPVLVNAIGSGAPLSAALGGSLAAAALPGVVSGVLFLISAHYDREAGGVPPQRHLTPAS